jgi:predicted nucleic acid-binding protein
VAWKNSVPGDAQYLSVLTFGELTRGITQLARRDGPRSAALQRWLIGLREAYADRIIGVDREIAERWGRLDAGRSLPVIDSLLAATALVHGMTIVTRNVRDVAETGALTLNPWEA